MNLSLHNLKPAAGSNKSKKRVGRGNASGKGTYSSRGMKGQRSRAGGKTGLKRLGFKPNLQNVKKMRGFNSIRIAQTEIKASDLETHYTNGDTVNPTTLQEKGLIKSVKESVKILSNGKLTKKLNISGCSVSAPAQKKIEEAGGTVEGPKS